MRKSESPDKECVRTFVKFLRSNGYPRLKVHSWPDSKKNGDIDAIAGPFAIEHTSIDTIQDQRLKSDWFLKAINGLEAEFSHKLPYRLNITFHYDSIRKGQDWQGIRNALKSWIIYDSQAIPDGSHVFKNISGIPFEFRVSKRLSNNQGICFIRTEPTDTSLPKRLRVQLAAKATKLLRYKAKGKITILLVESEDLALMNEHKMLNALRTAFNNCLPADVDQLWYADTSIPSEVMFCDFSSVIQKSCE